MDEIIFKPKYRLGIWIMVTGGPLFGLLLILMAIDVGKADLPVYLFCLMLFASGAIAPLILIKRIRFGQSITVERYLLSEKVIAYSDVSDIGNTVIATKKGAIQIKDMVNRGQLLAILTALIEQGSIQELQLKGELVTDEKAAFKAMPITILVSLLLFFVLIVFGVVSETLDFRIFLLIVLIPIYWTAYAMLKRRYRK